MNVFDREIWLEPDFTFGENIGYDGRYEYPVQINIHDSIPLWPCPNCWKTSLTLIKEIEVENYPICEAGDMTADDGCYLCNGYLECKKCGYLYSFLGDVFVEMLQYQGENDFGACYKSTCRPKFFHRNLRLFRFEESYPKEITKILDKSFAHYFSDIHAATSMLRAAVEKLLDLSKLGSIPRQRENGSYLSLDKRIKLSSEKRRINKKVKEKLLAIKWIGNNGAHLQETKDDKEQYLNIVEIFHDVLDEKFSGRKQRIERTARKINKSKGGKST